MALLYTFDFSFAVSVTLRKTIHVSAVRTISFSNWYLFIWEKHENILICGTYYFEIRTTNQRMIFVGQFVCSKKKQNKTKKIQKTIQNETNTKKKNNTNILSNELEGDVVGKQNVDTTLRYWLAQHKRVVSVRVHIIQAYKSWYANDVYACLNDKASVVLPVDEVANKSRSKYGETKETRETWFYRQEMQLFRRHNTRVMNLVKKKKKCAHWLCARANTRKVRNNRITSVPAETSNGRFKLNEIINTYPTGHG